MSFIARNTLSNIVTENNLIYPYLRHHMESDLTSIFYALLDNFNLSEYKSKLKPS